MGPGVGELSTVGTGGGDRDGEGGGGGGGGGDGGAGGLVSGSTLAEIFPDLYSDDCPLNRRNPVFPFK